MPLFDRELNALGDDIGASTLTFYLYTAEPSGTGFTTGRVTVGGTAYENGVAITATQISNASSGDITITADIDFGTADEDVGTVTHLGFWRGSNAVGYVPIPNTAINSGDSFKINANTLNINGATS